MLSNEVKRAMLKGLSNDEMLRYFIKLHDEYNPVDYDKCDTYELVKTMMLERMSKED